MFNLNNTKMLKKILIMSVAVVLFMACQEEEVISSDFDVLDVEKIDIEALPTTSQSYIDENFEGEVVTSAYKVTSTTDATVYEAFLTNNMNLVFDVEGNLEGFGEESSRVDCSGRAHRHHRRHHGHGDGDNRPPRPEEVEVSELPSAASDYLLTNYPDEEILKVLFINNDSTTGFHVLIKELGAVIFDIDGNFLALWERPDRPCGNFEPIAIEDLSASIMDYISTSYPENEILKARIGTRGEIVEIHVLLKDVGVLIFDEDGNFIELKTCGMNRGA